MKLLATLFLLVSFASPVFATIDGNADVFIVAKNYESDEYFAQKVPIVGCYGLARGPNLSQLTAEYMIPESVGCGERVGKINLNALTCGKVVDSKESNDNSTFSEITLDISKCADKNDKGFLDTLNKVIRLNFKTKTQKNVKLFLRK